MRITLAIASILAFGYLMYTLLGLLGSLLAF
jgi:hypothetical protein